MSRACLVLLLTVVAAACEKIVQREGAESSTYRGRSRGIDHSHVASLGGVGGQRVKEAPPPDAAGASQAVTARTVGTEMSGDPGGVGLARLRARAEKSAGGTEM